MTHAGLKKIVFGVAIVIATSTTTYANSGYWVVGNLVTNSCDIVSLSPLVSPSGPVWFGNGPHKSYDEAKLARRQISACPRSDKIASR